MCEFCASQAACNSEQRAFAEDACCDVFQKGNKYVMAACHWLVTHSCNCKVVHVLDVKIELLHSHPHPGSSGFFKR